MSNQELAAALLRAEAVLRRRPDMGMHPDAAATARWTHGTRVVAGHANGAQVSTDMPTELGGTGDCVTPGWLFRAGIGSCAATSIVMAAAGAGVTLGTLEVEVNSESDTRGLLGMPDENGSAIYPGPKTLSLQVRIGAPGLDAERLRALVDAGLQRSPIPCAVRGAGPLAVSVEIVGS